MPKGTISSIVADRGFGFIGTAEGAYFFFHRGAIQVVDYTSIREGIAVEFEIGKGTDGRTEAVKVRIALPKTDQQ